jgi:hypothetical protein
VAGITKLTFSQERTASKEKKASAIKAFGGSEQNHKIVVSRDPKGLAWRHLMRRGVQ